MASRDDSSLAFLFIVVTIQKSASFIIVNLLLFIKSNFRCLVACIRFLAHCLCMRCYCPKSKAHLLGSKWDMRNRENHIRVDNETVQQLIETTQGWIFERGFAVGSKHVKDWLHKQSLHPLRVCIHF